MNGDCPDKTCVNGDCPDKTCVNGDSVVTRPEVTDRGQTTLNGDSDKSYSQRQGLDTVNGDSFPNKTCSHRDWTL